MKILPLLIFLLNMANANAQQIRLRGSIIDAKTNLAIASVTISVSEKNLFYPANNDGKFDIITDKIVKTDLVAFSCIGYQTKKIKAGDIPTNSIIKLLPLVNMLREVKIGVNVPLPIKVGSNQKNSLLMALTYPGANMATFMEGSKNVKGVIQTVGFYLSDGTEYAKGGDVTGPFRIRLFSVDTDGKPGTELTKDIIIVSAKKNLSWFEVDISAYRIQNPDSGFFASFTLLSHEYYKLKRGAKTTDEFGGKWETIDTSGVHHDFGAKYTADVVTPRLGLCLLKFKQMRSYFTCTTLQNMSWHWEKNIYNPGYMIRAAIAPE